MAYPPDEDELCTLVAGRGRLTGVDGVARESGPGDSFMVRGGFEGVWETLEPLRKVNVIARRP